MEISINGRFLSQRATGVQRVARECVKAIDRLKGSGLYPSIHFHLICPEDGDATSLALRHVKTIKTSGRGGHIWEQRVLPRHAGDRLLCLGNSAPITSMLSRQRVSVMLHDQSYRLFPRDYSRSYRLLHAVLDHFILNKSEPLLLVSESEKAVLLRRQRISAEMTVAPNGSWENDELPPHDQNQRPPAGGYGLYVGTLSERKNVDGILEAALGAARERGRSFVFVGAINAWAMDAQDRIPADLRHLIQFRGFVADEDLPDLYRSAAYLLYPSFYEASGLPPSEAMTFGCPVITSDLPVMRERCEDAALYCDPHDRASITRTVFSLLDDPDRQQALSLAGRARAADLTWEKQGRLIIDAIL